MFFKDQRIYLDHASATPLDPIVVEAVSKAGKLVGNAGAIHHEGVVASRVLEKSRQRVAAQLGCKAREVIFTSGLTESNNLSVLGFARKYFLKGNALTGTHWLVSAIEHPSVLESFGEIERMGGSVSHVMPDSRGIITPEAVRHMLRKETVFVSVGWANNEIGVVQPLSDISRVIRSHETQHKTVVVLHTDAGQAPLYRASTVHSLGVDLFALGAHKLYGPEGVGALYIHNRVELAATSLGGAQERKLRAGTESVSLAVGCAETLERIMQDRAEETMRLKKLRDAFANDILKLLPDAVINGALDHALPHMLNVSIPGIHSEYLTLALDHAGVSVSTKSTCREGSARSSHVVEALGGPQWRAENTLRFSLGKSTNAKDLRYAAETLARLVHMSRAVGQQSSG
jgi:cysteine desulfurase